MEQKLLKAYELRKEFLNNMADALKAQYGLDRHVESLGDLYAQREQEEEAQEKDKGFSA